MAGDFGGIARVTVEPGPAVPIERGAREKDYLAATAFAAEAELVLKGSRKQGCDAPDLHVQGPVSSSPVVG